jgi:hypothetical protein
MIVNYRQQAPPCPCQPQSSAPPQLLASAAPSSLAPPCCTTTVTIFVKARANSAGFFPSPLAGLLHARARRGKPYSASLFLPFLEQPPRRGSRVPACRSPRLAVAGTGVAIARQRRRAPARRRAHFGQPSGHPTAPSMRLSVLSTLVPTVSPEGLPLVSSGRRSSSPTWLRLIGGVRLTPGPSCCVWCQIWGTRDIFGSVFEENDF